MNERPMKGITCCADCTYYSLKKHKCVRGCNDDTDPRASFYGDCPLPDAVPVKQAKWIIRNWGDDAVCSGCGRTQKCAYDVENFDNFCHHCGAKMVGIMNREEVCHSVEDGPDKAD